MHFSSPFLYIHMYICLLERGEISEDLCCFVLPMLTKETLPWNFKVHTRGSYVRNLISPVGVIQTLSLNL